MALYQVRRRIFWGLIAAALVSGMIALKVELDKRRLASAYANVHAALTQLEQERGQLNQELAHARQTIDSQATDVTQLEAELARL